jgi:hypothetical protein
VSIDRVKNEIDRGKDALADWATRDFSSWFVSTADLSVLNAYRAIMIWTQTQGQFSEEARAEFAEADNADAWIIAYANANGHTVVTQEKYNPETRNRIPIPNVCRAFDVPYVDVFEMLRQLGARLG